MHNGVDIERIGQDRLDIWLARECIVHVTGACDRELHVLELKVVVVVEVVEPPAHAAGVQDGHLVLESQKCLDSGVFDIDDPHWEVFVIPENLFVRPAERRVSRIIQGKRNQDAHVPALNHDAEVSKGHLLSH